MDDKQPSSSGLATPPIVSPRAIPTAKGADESDWKTVGSPPRKTLLSPPDEKDHGSGSQPRHQRHDSHDGPAVSNTPETNSRANAAVTADDSADWLISLPTDTSPAPAPAPVRAAQDPPFAGHHSHPVHESPLHTPTTPSPSAQSLMGFAPSASRLDGLLGSLAPNLPAASRPSQDLSFGPLDMMTSVNSSQRDGSAPFHATSAALSNARSASGLESPLALSSFAWNGSVTDEDGVGSLTTLATSVGGLTTGMRQDGAIGVSNSIYSMTSALNVDPFAPNPYRTARSFSLSEPPGFSTGFGGSSSNRMNNTFDTEQSDALGSFRLPLPTMEEEGEDAFEPRASRTRSYSTSAAFGPGAFYGASSSNALPYRDRQSSMATSSSLSSSGSMALLDSQDHHPFAGRKISGGSTWPSISQHNASHSRPSVVPAHRRSLTSGSYMSQASPIWETSNTFLPPAEQQVAKREPSEGAFGFQGRRFSLAQASGFKTYDQYVEREQLGGGGPLAASSYDNYSEFAHQQRRHSVAGPSGSYYRPTNTGSARPYNLASSLESLQLDEAEQPNNNWNLTEEYDRDDYQYSSNQPSSGVSDLGKGLTLSQLSNHGSLYVVEFKAGRSDLFYVADNSGLSFKSGDLVMVEADRGKDLGKITNDSITPQQIQDMQKQHAEAAAAAQQEGARAPKEIHPKRIFRMAHASEIADLVIKSQDEISAMKVCQSKVRQKKLPMEVVDAEFQWDRRKLTFYFQAEHRIDFRELVRDLFKTYKTRIWMYAVNGSLPAGLSREAGGQSSPPRGMTSPASSHVSSQPRHSNANAYQQPHDHSYQHAQHQQHHHHGHRHHEPHHHQQQQQFQQQQQQLHHHPLGQYHPSQPQLQELVRQVQSHYFAAPTSQPSSSLFPSGFQHGQMQPMEEEELLQAQCPPFMEQFHPLQPPHPLS
ncbi:hypothetical protein EC968_008950 [Mortierella alpina]|nr:hypothetical protein EC968_008950 [Mortierella alpina]